MWVIFPRCARGLRLENVTPFPDGPCLWRARSRGRHQVKVFWDRSDSVRVQGHLRRPDEATGIRAHDPHRSSRSLG
jgi:hypothetical protein